MASKQAKSFFSYGVSRSFPFRWFTPVALVSLLIFAVLFSFLNYISTGFLLDVEISADPNATMAGETWLRHWPSFIFNLRPVCQAATLPVGAQFFTNQTALLYTLNAVWQQNDSSSSIHVLPGLTYFNNVLEDCTISFVEIEAEALDRTANQIAYSEWGEVVRTFATCSIPSAEDRNWFNITQEYDYVPPTISYVGLWTGDYNFLGTNFLERNQWNKTSLWWGESLMSTYWYDQRANATAGIRKGALSFSPLDNSKPIMNSDYFRIDFRFITDLGPVDGYIVTFPGTYNWEYSVEMLVAQHAYPDIWNWTDRLAKSAYSTVLVDLGQDAIDTVLTDATTLRDYTQVFDTVQSDNEPFIANAKPGPATASYDGTGPPLKITPSVIATEYLCQVPKRKSILNLLVSILVADLVFLQVVWRLLMLVSEILLRKIPTAQYCEGCIKHILRDSAGDSPRQTDELQNDGGSYSLYTFDAPSASSGGGYSGGRGRSVSEQFLIPRPTFQRQYTDF